MSIRNRISVLLLAACLLSYAVVAQPIVKLWDKTIGGNSFDYNIANMIITPSKKILVDCVSASDAGFDKTVSRKDTIYCVNGCKGTWVFSLDKFGNKLWDQTYGGLHGCTPYGMVMQNNNSFILNCLINSYDTTFDVTAPLFYPYSTSGTGIWILDIDSLGNKIWNSRYLAQTTSLIQNQSIIDDSNLYITGHRTSSTQPLVYGNFLDTICGSVTDMVTFKINTVSKNFEWHLNTGGDSLDASTDLVMNNKKELVILGNSNSTISCNQTLNQYGLNDYYIYCIDTLGVIKWQKHYGGSENDFPSSIILTNDGGYLLYGNTWSPQGFDISQTTSNDSSLWIIKIDSMGTKVWDKRFGSCIRTLFLNKAYVYGKARTNHLIIKTSDGGYLFAAGARGTPCGDVSEAARGMVDYWLIKIDEEGNKLWEKRFGGLLNDNVESLAEMDTGIYVVGGCSNSGIGGDKTEASRGLDDLWFICFADTTTANLTSINEITQKQITLGVWPNPANDVLNYELTGNEKIKNITLSNMLGEKVIEVNSPTSNTIQISKLQSGVYLFNCETMKGRRFVKKVMVTK